MHKQKGDQIMFYKIARSTIIAIPFLIHPACAEPVKTLVVSCTTEEAITAYFSRTYIGKEMATNVLADLNKTSEVCSLSMSLFEKIKDLTVSQTNGLKYTIVQIQMIATFEPLGAGLSEVKPQNDIRYVMWYKKIEGTET